MTIFEACKGENGTGVPEWLKADLIGLALVGGEIAVVL